MIGFYTLKQTEKCIIQNLENILHLGIYVDVT